MTVAVRHDAISDTVARLALTVRQFEDELDALAAEGNRRLTPANAICEHRRPPLEVTAPR